MIHPEGPSSRAIVFELLQSQDAGVRGVTYTSAPLLNEAAGISIEAGPDDAVTPTYMLLDWPDTRVTTARLEAVGLTADPNTDLDRINPESVRSLVLGASLGSTVLSQDPALRDARRKLAQLSNGHPETTLASMCGVAGVPLVGIALGRMESSNAPTATLWHPALLSPRRSLLVVQDAVRKALRERPSS